MNFCQILYCIYSWGIFREVALCHQKTIKLIGLPTNAADAPTQQKNLENCRSSEEF